MEEGRRKEEESERKEKENGRGKRAGEGKDELFFARKKVWEGGRDEGRSRMIEVGR